MGLFQHKKTDKPTSKDEALANEEHFFDEYFREELRNHGRFYFEKVIKENGQLFKKDLDETVARINDELKTHITSQLDSAIEQFKTDIKEHVTSQLDTQLAEYGKSMQETQDQALDTLKSTAQTLQEQHKTLSETLEKDVSEQKALLHTAFEDNKAQMVAMKDAQDSAMQWLNQSAQAMQEQYKTLSETLDKEVAAQKEVLVGAFEENMARVIEQHLLGALGDQFDLKAQLPAIIDQMESQKQAIVDDIKL